MYLTNSAVSVSSSLCCGWCQTAESAELPAPTFPGMVNGCVARPPNFRRGDATSPPLRRAAPRPHARPREQPGSWAEPVQEDTAAWRKKCCREAGAVAVYCGGRTSSLLLSFPYVLPPPTAAATTSGAGQSLLLHLRGREALPPLTTCVCAWYRSEGLRNDTGTRFPRSSSHSSALVSRVTGCSRA